MRDQLPDARVRWEGPVLLPSEPYPESGCNKVHSAWQDEKRSVFLELERVFTIRQGGNLTHDTQLTGFCLWIWLEVTHGLEKNLLETNEEGKRRLGHYSILLLDINCGSAVP